MKSITDLHGHSIEQWRVHGAKSVPNFDNGDVTRMEEGELFAIETFGSTGTGHVSTWFACAYYCVYMSRSTYSFTGCLASSGGSFLFLRSVASLVKKFEFLKNMTFKWQAVVPHTR